MHSRKLNQQRNLDLAVTNRHRGYTHGKGFPGLTGNDLFECEVFIKGFGQARNDLGRQNTYQARCALSCGVLELCITDTDVPRPVVDNKLVDEVRHTSNISELPE